MSPASKTIFDSKGAAMSDPIPTADVLAEQTPACGHTAAVAERFGIDLRDGMTFEQVLDVAVRRLHMAREGQTAAQELNATLRSQADAAAAEMARMRGDLDAMRTLLGDDDVELGAVPGLLRVRLAKDGGALRQALCEMTGKAVPAAALDYLRCALEMAQGFEQVRAVLYPDLSSADRLGVSVAAVLAAARLGHGSRSEVAALIDAMDEVDFDGALSAIQKNERDLDAICLLVDTYESEVAVERVRALRNGAQDTLARANLLDLLRACGVAVDEGAEPGTTHVGAAMRNLRRMNDEVIESYQALAALQDENDRLKAGTDRLLDLVRDVAACVVKAEQ